MWTYICVSTQIYKKVLQFQNYSDKSIRNKKKLSCEEVSYFCPYSFTVPQAMKSQNPVLKPLSSTLLLAFGLFLAACKPLAPELPYEEKIVVRGLLEAGQPLADVQISRTIPALDEFSYEKIFVGDARATVTIDGRSYAMELQPRTSTSATVPYRSLYRVPSLRVEAGKTYTLEVRWKNLVASAETRVPLVAELDSVNVVASIVPSRLGSEVVYDTVFESSAIIRARANEVYRVGTTLNEVASGRLVSARGFGEASLIPSVQIVALTSNTWRFTTATVQVLSNRLQSRVNVEAYDGTFFAYYQTRSRSGQVGLFSPGGPNISWNVTDDGIGEFSGMSVVQRRAFVRVR